MRRRTSLGIVVCLAIARIGLADEATNSTGASQPVPWEKGNIVFGGFVAAFDSTVAFGLNNASGININGEDLLGLDSSLTVFRGGGMYRPGSSLRHQIDISYAGYHRSGEANLSESLTIGGITYPIGAHVSTIFNFDIIRATYTYAILQDDRMRVALGGGVYVVPLKYGLQIQTAGGLNGIQGADTTLPLPALALRTDFQLVRRLFFNASIEAMYLEISDYKGSLLDVNVGLEYRPWDHFAFGAGYSAMAMDIESDNVRSDYPGADFVGKVGVHFSGLMLYGKVTF